VLKDGALENIDIVRAIQSPSRDGQSGGKTQFHEITGDLQTAGSRLSYRNLQLNSGPMTATGTLDVLPNTSLSGISNVRVGSAAVTVARGVLKIGGTLQNPLLTP
jgi:hypothetical protein